MISSPAPEPIGGKLSGVVIGFLLLCIVCQPSVVECPLPTPTLRGEGGERVASDFPRPRPTLLDAVGPTTFE